MEKHRTNTAKEPNIFSKLLLQFSFLYLKVDIFIFYEVREVTLLKRF